MGTYHALDIRGLVPKKVEGRVEGGAQKMGCVVGCTVLEESSVVSLASSLRMRQKSRDFFHFLQALPTCPLLVATWKPQSSDVCCPKWRVRAWGPGVDLACQCCCSSPACAQRGKVLIPLCTQPVLHTSWVSDEQPAGESPLSSDCQWVRLVRSLADKMDGCWPWTWQRRWGFQGKKQKDRQATVVSVCSIWEMHGFALKPLPSHMPYHKRGFCKGSKY